MNTLMNPGKWVRLSALLVLQQLFFLQSAGAAQETFTNRPGSDLPGTPFSISHDKEGFVAVTECETACKNNPECRAYTYVKPGIQGPDGYCWLKNDVPAPVKDTCCTSGVVRPKTDADRCTLYATQAAQQNQSNIDWWCDYTGPRWTSTYKAHYDWCMAVPASTADFEAAERQKLLSTCWSSASTSGDLSASDWCYEISEAGSTITFLPIIANVGPTHWKSQIAGYYAIGAQLNSVITEEKHALNAYPYWSLKRNDTARLEGISLAFDPKNAYRIVNLWGLYHPEDVNQGNNSHPGLAGIYTGSAFQTDPALVLNKCTYSEGKRFMTPVFGLKPVIGKRRVLAVLWDPKRTTDPALPKSTIETAIFGQTTSVREYFLENSGNRFTIENAGVVGWYDADEPASHYWRADKTTCKHGFKEGHVEKWAEAIRKAANDMDFKTFDTNGDGRLSPDELTVLVVIPQNSPFGTERNVVGKEDPREDLIVDGVKIDTIVEAYIGSPASIGLVAHELSHILLGAGDMYFSFFQPYAAGKYSLMDDSTVNPPHLDPFHKMKLAWVVPKIITRSGQYEIKDVETSNEVYILSKPSHGTTEYFIVENRWRGTSYDQFLPFSGLAVWQIIEDPKVHGSLPVPPSVNASDWNDAKWQGWARKGIRMIRPIYGPPYNNALWDGGAAQTGYDLLSVDTNPNHVTLRWADGTASGFAIRSIPAAAQTMNVFIEVQGD